MNYCISVLLLAVSTISVGPSRSKKYTTRNRIEKPQLWKLEVKFKEAYRTKEKEMRADFQWTVEAKEKRLGEMFTEIELLFKTFDLFIDTQTSNFHYIWNRKFQELAQIENHLMRVSYNLQVWEDKLAAVEQTIDYTYCSYKPTKLKWKS